MNSPPNAWEFMGDPPTLPYTPLEPNEATPASKSFKAWDKRTCECPMPMTMRKQHRALGRGSGVRLCCMARALEAYMELPEGALYFWMDFEPDWEWKEKELVQDGEEWVERGSPPAWLEKRLREKELLHA